MANDITADDVLTPLTLGKAELNRIFNEIQKNGILPHTQTFTKQMSDTEEPSAFEYDLDAMGIQEDGIATLLKSTIQTEGKDGELIYVYNDKFWASKISVLLEDKTEFKDFEINAINKKDFNQLLQYVNRLGFSVNKREVSVYKETIRTSEHEKEETVLTYLLPVYGNNGQVGNLAYNDKENKSLFIQGDHISYAENNTVVTAQGDTCVISFINCLLNCLGCTSVPTCAILGGACLSSCCACASIIGCLGCYACAFSVGWCSAKCS